MNKDWFIAQLNNKYPDYLRMIIQKKPFEPVKLWGGKKKPETTAKLHEAIGLFLKFEKKGDLPGWVIEWKPWTSRKFGRQRWPSSILLPAEHDFLFILDKEKEVSVFCSILDRLLIWNYKIADWLTSNPLIILKYDSAWKGICEVTDFLLLEDAGLYYTRNLPVSVHTKFIEKYASVILSLLIFLDPVRFPPESKNLETAAGLRKKPHLYSMRWLDESFAYQYTAGFDILALPFNTLKKATWEIPEIWVVENETNLYLLAGRKSALAIFAKGYALHNLKNIPFFDKARLFYWGDLDEDGYLMLQQFRQHYPHTVSVLMDEKTVSFHKEQLNHITYRYNRHDLELHPEERAGYLFLVEKQGRIEQEKLQQEFVQQYIRNIGFS